jgi:carotenoid cleavage dioxygenase-like enzyme
MLPTYYVSGASEICAYVPHTQFKKSRCDKNIFLHIAYVLAASSRGPSSARLFSTLGATKIFGVQPCDSTAVFHCMNAHSKPSHSVLRDFLKGSSTTCVHTYSKAARSSRGMRRHSSTRSIRSTRLLNPSSIRLTRLPRRTPFHQIFPAAPIAAAATT